MAVGCDPSTHPTAQWIEDHIDEYTDWDNPWKEVAGKAFCETDDDCTIATTSRSAVKTGSCSKNRCECSGNTWKGPRCTVASGSTTSGGGGSSGMFADGSYGPPMYVSLSVSGITILTTFVAVYFSVLATRKSDEELRQKILQQQIKHPARTASVASAGELKPPRDNYSTNFV